MHAARRARGLDVVLAVPFQSQTAFFIDPPTRRSAGVHWGAHVYSAIAELTELVGVPLDDWDRFGPSFADGQPLRHEAHRSLSAVALATVLERAGLRWKVLDPGTEELAWFRQALLRLAPLEPALFGICSTFVVNGAWLKMLIAIARRILPHTKIAVGGYYYASDTNAFLSLDADILFVGEGEVRFPELVRAVAEERALEHIPGMYLRQPNGTLKFTGPVEPLDLSRHSRPDWTLASKIEPPVSLEHDSVRAAVETQRGCVFKCEFCTFRTLSSPSVMDPHSAVDRIMDTAALRTGTIALSDATATFPHARWREMCELLSARGGAPHPAWAYARVSDLDEPTARLMRSANVRVLLIGQESGDQRILDLMRKGTRVAQVRPAIRALAQHDIHVVMSMICGFPGETLESVENTRQLLMTINDECPDRPVVLLYKLVPFHLDDFAAVAQDDDLDERRDPRFRFASRDFTIEQAGREALRSLIEISKRPHAPATGWASGFEYYRVDLLTGPRRFEIFRWMKDIDRAMGMLLEHRVFGVRPSRAELATLRDRIMRPLPVRGRLDAARTRLRAHAERRAISLLRREWLDAPPEKMGALTRAIVGARALYDGGDVRDALLSAHAGTYAPRATLSAPQADVPGHAESLITDATRRARKVKLNVTS